MSHDDQLCSVLSVRERTTNSQVQDDLRRVDDTYPLRMYAFMRMKSAIGEIKRAAFRSIIDVASDNILSDVLHSQTNERKVQYSIISTGNYCITLI